jgi:hypothetical protein
MKLLLKLSRIKEIAKYYIVDLLQICYFYYSYSYLTKQFTDKYNWV